MIERHISRRVQFSHCIFTLFFIGLLFSSYIAFGEEYILLCGGIALVVMMKNLKKVAIKDKIWYLFLLYYVFTTALGFALGLVEAKGILELIIQYPIMIFILITIIRKCKSIDNTLRIFKNFILVSAIYGLIESVLRHNILPDIFSSPVMERIRTMNLMAYKYQASSIFLHYTYFGVVLVVGMVINLIYPYKNRIVNIAYFALIFVDLYFSKSRMCLLLAITILIYDVHKRGAITEKMLKKAFGVAIGLSIVTLLFWNKLLTAFQDIYDKFAVVRQYGFESGSFGQRVGTLLNVPSYMFTHPFRGIFGTGFESIKKAYLDNYSYFSGYGIADNQLTTFLIEVGIIGTLIVIWGIIKFFKKNKIKRSISKYLLVVILFSSITLDVVGTIYLTALVFLPFCIFYEWERGNIHAQHTR